MKKLVFILVLGASLSVYAEYVSSSFEKLPVNFIAEAGSVVKKGKPLFKLSNDIQKMHIEKKKLNIKNALIELEDKTTDLNRAKVLLSKKAISIEDYEDIVLAYFKSSISYEKLKQEQKQLEIDLDGFTVNAPYDCRVVEQKICTNSGVDYGTHVVEIQELNQGTKNSEKNKDCSKTLILTSVLSGETIIYLPKNSQVVKKGDLLVKYDTAVIELELKVLKSQLKEANECLKDSKTDCDRAKKLYNKKIISKNDFDNICLLYKKCKIAVDILKIDIKIEEFKIKHYFSTYAPYDLRVAKRILSVNSGVKVAKTILELQKI